ncbi:MAG: extracellular solute-binding protein, partial [Pseudomonadota bacterium]|nr:extracellular solute-binding protein [Pseudomonadota bacterium]
MIAGRPVNRIDRRRFIGTGAAAALAAGAPGMLAWPGAVLAANPVEMPLHGLSAFGELKYGPGFEHFDYAAPDAPAGGTFAFQASNWRYNQNPQTFDTLNSFVLRGAAPPRLELCYDTLMVRAWDEPDAVYGALAEHVTISADRNRYRFALRREARFHDDSPVTSTDVAFSFRLMKDKGHPNIANDLVNLDDALALEPHVFELRFNGRQSPRAILALADTVPVLSHAYYETREFDAATLEAPLSSGPWRVAELRQGSFIEYARVENYWGRDMNFARGLDHFDRLRIDFFRERTAAMEAFKKGLVGWREEFTAKFWATEYDFPAAREGKVRQTTFASEKTPSLQGWAINNRRQKFADRRTRRALGMLFDFEWTNRNLFHDAYRRSHSMFEGSDLAARGMPSGEELALLEPLGDTLPEAVFGEAVMQNVTDGTGQDRSMLVEAYRLLVEAGWRRKDGMLVDADGAPLSVEVLIRAQVFERILGPYIRNMERMGIAATIRLVDA